MTTLTELEKLADDAAERTPGEWGKGEGYYGYIDQKDGRYVCTLHNNIKQLLALCRMQHAALKSSVMTDVVYEALAAYEQMNGEK